MNDQELMEAFLEQVDAKVERDYFETGIFFPLTDKAARMNTTKHSKEELEAAGWVHIDNITDEQLRELAQNNPDTFHHVFDVLMDRIAYQDGFVRLVTEDGKDVYKKRDDLTLEDMEAFGRYLDQEIEQGEEKLALAERAAMIMSVDRTARALAGEEIPEDETFGDILKRLDK